MILFVIFLCALGFQFLQSFLFKKYWNKNVDVKITLDSTQCVVGDENVMREIITNNKWLPLPVLHVKFNTPKSFVFDNEENSSVTDYYYRDDLFSIFSHQSITRTLKFTCTKRGCFYLHDTSITSTDLFMRNIFTDTRPNDIIVHVYPKKVDISFFEIPFRTITGAIATQKTLIEDPFEFRGIREYQPYDNMHNINWKSSAKNNVLLVNTFFMTSSQSVKIILNLETEIYSRDEKLIEEIISLASSLAEKLISEGVPISLDTNGLDMFTKERICRESGSGVNHMVSIDTALARLDTDAQHLNFLQLLEEIFETPEETAYHIIISNNRHQELVDLYRKLKSTNENIFFIVPEMIYYKDDLPDSEMIRWDIE